MKYIIIVIVIAIIVMTLLPTQYPLNPTLGVTFSPMYSKYLKQDWQNMYLSTLDDLKVKHLRIPTYWSEIEKSEGQYDFSEVDFMIEEAQKRGAKIVMVVGIKQPRWPEYHLPEWVKPLTTKQKQQKALELTAEIIKRYSSSPAITSWQVENEPFVTWFGEDVDSNLVNQQFLEKEVKLVKSLDPNRSIIITDTGEWSSWLPAAKSGDTLGISLYRKAYNPYIGYITYPFFPWIYSFKSKIIGSNTIISELQAEPWLKKGILETSVEEQARLFSVKELTDNVSYASKTGFSEVYLWGVEWWYYMAQNDHPEYLEYTRNVFFP